MKLGGRKIDLRAATLPTVYGEKVVLRLLDTASVEVDLLKLGFASEALEGYQQVFRRPYGTILVTGPTGSGKSTTLYATLKELNSPERNIITVEDPVEFRLGDTSDVCTHGGASLSEGFVVGDEIECPWHSGRFCIRDGKATALPGDRADQGLPDPGRGRPDLHRDAAGRD